MLKRKFFQILSLFCMILSISKVSQASDTIDNPNAPMMDSKRTKLMMKDESHPLAQLRSDLLHNSNLDWGEVIAATKQNKYYHKRGYGKHTRNRQCGNKQAIAAERARQEALRRQEQIRIQQEEQERARQEALRRQEQIRIQQEEQERERQEALRRQEQIRIQQEEQKRERQEALRRQEQIRIQQEEQERARQEELRRQAQIREQQEEEERKARSARESELPTSSSSDDEDVYPVTVRVWNDASHGGVHVGHVSLDTGKCYISLWPSSSYQDPDRVGGNLHMGDNIGGRLIGKFASCCIAAKAIGMTLIGDLVAEERAPEQVYQLMLNTRKINNYWNRLCATANREEYLCFEDVGEPQYAKMMVAFEDLIWYVGGDPSKHKIEQGADWTRRLKGQFYSCASMALHMLVIGEINQRGKIDDNILSDLIPAVERSWYRNLLSNPDDFLVVEDDPHRYGDMSESTIAKILRPVVCKVTASDYVAPWQVGELVRRCCVNQYTALLKVPTQSFQEDALRLYLEGVLVNHYPEKNVLDKLKYWLETSPNFLRPGITLDESQKLAILGYIYAKGRTIEDFRNLLEIEITRTTPTSSGWCCVS